MTSFDTVVPISGSSGLPVTYYLKLGCEPPKRISFRPLRVFELHTNSSYKVIMRGVLSLEAE